MSKKFKYLSEDPKQLVQQLAIIIHNCRIYNIELDKKIEEEFRQRDERRKQKLLDIEAMKKEKSEKGIFGDFLPDWFKRY